MLILMFYQAAPLLNTQSKILAIAAVVFAAVQAIKKVFPTLSGWWALAINVALSVGGVLAVVQPQDLFSVQTLIAVITATAGSAGIHGTWSNLLSPKS